MIETHPFMPDPNDETKCTYHNGRYPCAFRAEEHESGQGDGTTQLVLFETA
jgi:hypothetical protein